MKSYRNTDYALNKYSKGIVYKFADGIVETTLEDYLCENPENTEEGFVKLKALSDEIYYEQDRHYVRTTRLDISVHCMKCEENILVSSFFSGMEEEDEKEKALAAAKKLLDSGKLTEIQKRRFYLYFFIGLSTRQIARQEKVHQKTVWDSLKWITKKLRKFFEG